MERIRRKILITVKTYPYLSIQHQEIVCTAGFLEDGTWIRLYPIRYRYIKEQFKKYQWIEVEVAKHPRDNRPESYFLTGAIRLGLKIGTDHGWRERKRIVLTRGHTDICALNRTKDLEISLAVIKPFRIANFYWEPTTREWDQKQLDFMKQHQLFEEKAKPLEKIPYYFKYHIFCGSHTCPGHRIMIEDWETMQLYRAMRDKYGESVGLEKVKEKFFDQMCAPDRETYFFVSNHYRWKTWMIVGVFWPPKSAD